MSLDSLVSIREETRELADRFAARGFRLYLVGGVVRDGLLGLPMGPTLDLDFTTDAAPPEVKSILEGWAGTLWTQGERFGTIGARRGDRRLEITTHRTERYQPGSRRPDVEFADAIEVDLSRRDFTINALAVELPAGELVDPFGGEADLAARRLRTPLDPAETFSDDPLRMLRAARFLAQFDLVAEPGLVAAMTTMADRLEIVADERIRDELNRLLELADPVPGVELLFAAGLAERVLGPVGDGSKALERLRRAGPDRQVRLAVLLADVGSPEEARSALVARRAPTSDSRSVAAMLTAARRALDQPPDTLPALRRWVVDAGPVLDQAVAAASALGDAGTLSADVAGLLEAEPDLFDLPVLDGASIMALLGLEPGPEVGLCVEELRRLRLDSGPIGPEEAGNHLRQWHSQRVAAHST